MILDADQYALKFVDSGIADKLIKCFGKAIWPFSYRHQKPLKWILFLTQYSWKSIQRIQMKGIGI